MYFRCAWYSPKLDLCARVPLAPHNELSGGLGHALYSSLVDLHLGGVSARAGCRIIGDTVDAAADHWSTHEEP